MGHSGDWSREVRKQVPAMRAWRAALHREPELANEETKTRAKIVEALASLDIAPQTYEHFHGVRAVLAPTADGPAVALRADMDGLPVQEDTGLEFASRFSGRMHACGHDVHMTCLLGAAAAMKRHERELRGPVVLLFQPAEEEGETGGAGPFLARGCFDHPRVDFVVGQHVEPTIPAGKIGWRMGPLMAAADHFLIRVKGSGGHAAMPHRGPDAVVAAAEIVTGLQALVSRARDPLDPVVVSVGSIHGGTTDNVLPEEVVLEGTVRTFRPDTRDLIERILKRRVSHLASSMGAKATVRYERGYPVTVNEPRATARIVEGIKSEMGAGSLVEIERPVMGAEDFSRYLERVPGSFLFLGAGTGEPRTLHSPSFAPPEESMVTGAIALVAATAALQGGSP